MKTDDRNSQDIKVIVTGGAGFIGSALVYRLNQLGLTDILIVDNLRSSSKWKNLRALKYTDYLAREDFIEIIRNQPKDGKQIFGDYDYLFHMGACSFTTETDNHYLMQNNFAYTRDLFEYFTSTQCKFIYASSAATYGAEEDDFSDNYHSKRIDQLKPLNMYGYSKQLFDQYIFRKNAFDSVLGFKFFNVFGPNENHKGSQRSKIYKAYHEVKETGIVKLFKSHNDAWQDGEFVRDFIYVKDCVEIVVEAAIKNITGLYNLGTGKARSWNDLAKAVFLAMNKECHIEYISMPENLQNQYQYRTQADIKNLSFKLRGAESLKFTSLEEAVKDYIQNYLQKDFYLGDDANNTKEN